MDIEKLLELLVIQEEIKKQRELENQNERPFLQLEIEELDYNKIEKPNIEPKRVIVIDIWLLYNKKG